MYECFYCCFIRTNNVFLIECCVWKVSHRSNVSTSANFGTDFRKISSAKGR